MNIQIIQVPYDSGHRGLRTGRGPEYFLQHGIDRALQAAGHQVSSLRIESKAALTTEVGTAFELNRALAEQVRAAVQSTMFPLVLAGNCNSCLGTLAGVSQDHLGIIWLDAHGDLNTPETTLSGFFDGMGLAMAMGRCWRTLLGTIPGFQPVPEASVLHVGARDLDPAEEELLRQSEVKVVKPIGGESRIRNAIDTALDQLSDRAARVYLHIDMDVLDAGEALPNHLAVPGGLSIELVEELIRTIKERFKVCAGAMTSFDPEYDKNDAVLNAGIRIAKAFVA